MATIKFIVKSKESGKLAPIYLRYYEGKGIDIITKTNFRILPEAFGKGGKILKSACNDVFTEQDANNLKNSMGDLEQTIMKAVNNPGVTVSRKWLDDVIFKFHHPESLNQTDEKKTLNQFIDYYIEAAKTGQRLTEQTKQRFSNDTIKSLKSWKMNFDEFQKFRGKVVDYDDVTIDLYNELIQFFYGKLWRTNSIGKYVKALKTLMQAALDENQHNSMEFTRKAFKPLHHEVETIYLTESEIQALYNLKLNDEKQTFYRDVFLVGCFTAQRFSDYHRIHPGNIRTLKNGMLAVELNQKKTGTTVQIPCRPELAAILKKYNYTLPKTLEQVVNREIKFICRLAKIIQPIEIAEQIAGRTIKKTVAKCELVTTHCARRTGATNMFLSGIPAISCMKFTGHKTEKEFLKYIRLDSTATAEIYSGSAYFSPDVKLKVG